MPIISQFYGILIYIYNEKCGRYNMPHFHAKYAEYECVYDFDGNVIEGEFPKKQNKLVDAWSVLHAVELNAA